MTSSRLAGIPIDYVVAEIAAFPFASAASLSLRPSELDPGLRGCTGNLWRRAEAALVGSFPAFSVDEVVALRDRMWFGDGPPTATPLHTYLRRLARCFLEERGAMVHPCLPEIDRRQCANPNMHTTLARRAWRWMSLALPADLLLGAFGDRSSGPSRVQMVTPALETQLKDHGFAETHLHIGAALDFEQLWAAAMRGLARTELKADAFASPGAEFDEGRKLGPWLLRAAIVRYLLASFLRRPGGTLLYYLHHDVRQAFANHIGVANFSLLVRVLTDMEAGSLSDDLDFVALQALYAEMTRVGAERSVALADPFSADPIGATLSQHAHSPRTPEVRLIVSALEYFDACERTGRTDRLLTTLFWQTVRVRALFFRHVVHRPLTPGLQWFVRFYDRGGPGRRGMATGQFLESARAICGGDSGLRSLEIRTSPDSTRSEQQDYVEAIAKVAWQWHLEGAAGSDDLETGLVLHFIKSRAGGFSEGLPASHWSGTNADPLANNERCSGNPTGYRFARFYESRRREAMAVEWLLRHRPLSLEILRGLDVCTDEVGVPSWVIAPLLRRVRLAAEDGARALESYFGWSPPPPRTTAHAGEDFVHLLTGIRRLDETVDAFRLEAGDRIGHGLSLGIDPVDWAMRASRVLISKEERLFDLVWEWRLYALQGGCPNPSRLSYLNRQIPMLCEQVFGPQGYMARDVENLRRDLADPWQLYQVGFPEGPLPQGIDRNPRLKMLARYLSDPQVFRRSRELVWVETAPEAKVLAGLQERVRYKIGEIGITVEVNPTSNLLIGDLNDLTRHPLWRLSPVRENEADTPPVTICVGSDDPLVFNSNLRQEYQNLCDAMKLAGHSEEEVRRWIIRTRASGMESRFTLRPRLTRDPRCGSHILWFSQSEERCYLPI